MSASVQEQVKKHSSNPVRINLSQASAKSIERLAAKFKEEGLILKYTGRRVEEVAGDQIEEYEFLSTASNNNNHTGLIYRIMLGRQGKANPVSGSCSCTYTGLCKHLATAYLEAKELRNYQDRFCTCGAEFLLGNEFESEFCFDCLTDPAKFPYPGRLVDHDVNKMNTKAGCYWCSGPAEKESHARWIGPNGGAYYAHTSCEVAARKKVKHG